MTRAKFSGLLLLTTGIVLLFVGLFAGLPDFNKNSQTKSPEQIPENYLVQPKTNSFTVNLPAPRSVVGSPLLVRGRVYGSAKKIKLLLQTQQGLTLVDTISFVEDQKNESGLTSKKQSYTYFQTSLVFDKPSESAGKLFLNLLSDDDQVLDSEEVSVRFKL